MKITWIGPGIFSAKSWISSAEAWGDQHAVPPASPRIYHQILEVGQHVACFKARAQIVGGTFSDDRASSSR